ncbi:MAG: FecR family protein [Nitrospirales bacterium]|nr:FecR family protein [Nitrospirales bacterium]
MTYSSHAFAQRPRWACIGSFCAGFAFLAMSFGVASVSTVHAAAEPVANAVNAIGEFTVYRTDGIQEQLEGKGSLPLFDGDTVKTGTGSQALLEFSNGIQVALNENTEFLILSRWEEAKGFTRILRLSTGEVWVKTMGGPKPLEIETPVATAAVKQTEFDIKVQPDGQTTLTVVEGIVEFGTAFGTCPIRTSTISYGNRGKKCTKPAPFEVASNVAWTQGIRQ